MSDRYIAFLLINMFPGASSDYYREVSILDKNTFKERSVLAKLAKKDIQLVQKTNEIKILYIPY